MKKLFTLLVVLWALPTSAQFSISQLPPATTPLTGSELFPCTQAGATKKCLTSSVPVGANAAFVLQAPNAALPLSRTLVGTANEILLTDGGALGNLVLSTPQAIATTSSPTFSSLILTNPLTVPNGGTGVSTLTGLVLGNGVSAVTTYAGTSCTNQFTRSLSSSGVATCATVANTDLTNSSFTLNGAGVSLGGTRTLSLASADFANQGTTTTVLHGNAAGNPSFAAVNLTTDVSNILPVSSGGVGLSTLPAHGVLLGEGTGTVGNVAAMPVDTLLQGQGASADPNAVAVNNCGSTTTALSYSTSTHTFGCQTIGAGGSTTQMQYNNGGVLGGASNITYASASGDMTVAAPTSGIALSVAGVAGSTPLSLTTTSGTDSVRLFAPTGSANLFNFFINGTSTAEFGINHALPGAATGDIELITLTTGGFSISTDGGSTAGYTFGANNTGFTNANGFMTLSGTTNGFSWIDNSATTTNRSWSMGNFSAAWHLRPCNDNVSSCGADSITVNRSANVTSNVTISSAVLLPSLASSSAATTGTVCWTTGGNLTVDTTLACLASTARVKQAVLPLDSGLSAVMAMRPVSYELKPPYNPEHLGRQVGMIAEEVQKVDPRLVALDDTGQARGVRYMQLTAVLVKAIQQQQNEIFALWCGLVGSFAFTFFMTRGAR